MIIHSKLFKGNKKVNELIKLILIDIHNNRAAFKTCFAPHRRYIDSFLYIYSIYTVNAACGHLTRTMEIICEILGKSFVASSKRLKNMLFDEHFISYFDIGITKLFTKISNLFYELFIGTALTFDCEHENFTENINT